MRNKGKYRIVIEILSIIFGSLLIAIGANTLLIPANLLSGGVIGICMILYHFFHWSVGVQYFIYNIPLLILGYIHLGKKFILYTILAVISDTIFLHFIPIRLMWTDNIILASIFGGIISFAGGAIMLRVGGSNGGLDVLGRIIAKHKNLSIAKFGLIVNLIIVAISAVIFDVQAAMFTILSLYVGAKTYESLLNMAERSSVIIVTDKGEEISEALNQAFHRGVTSWDALGAYSHSEKQVILCVIVNIQWSELCQTVQSIDDHAFISAMPAQKVIGNFKNVW
ncbi:YitT family protein [Peribacillus butanolivorans]|uniref:YitT family protein n=1 Tax=Peribacillus butanolivorans TaxID=421767 RepID=UPI0037C7F01F